MGDNVKAEITMKQNQKAFADRYTDEEAQAHADAVGVDPRPAETRNELDDRGAFIRQPNAFATGFGEKEGLWKAEAGRYQIYWATGCNWSNRPVIVRDLLGLQDVIGDRLVYGTGETNKFGHGFSDQKNHRDPTTGAYFLSEFYKRAKPDFKGRATTPTLVDVKDRIAVNNDYHRLTNYIEVQFRQFQPKDAPDLYPKAYRREIDQFNDWLFPHINNAHYRMAFCQSYEAYQEAYDDFYDSMDKLDLRLSENRFLFGDYITDSDIRFYVTLVRWDLGYFQNIGPTKHRIVDYEHIWAYVRELYSILEFHRYVFLKWQAEREKEDSEERLFEGYMNRIAWQIDYEKLWEADHEVRRKLSHHPDAYFLKHPDDETPEDYQSEITPSPWNRENRQQRDPSDPKNSPLDADASINPLKGKIDA